MRRNESLRRPPRPPRLHARPQRQAAPDDGVFQASPPTLTGASHWRSLTDGLGARLPVRRTILELMERRLNAELFAMSRDYVGDTAETVALLWPSPPG